MRVTFDSRLSPALTSFAVRIICPAQLRAFGIASREPCGAVSEPIVERLLPDARLRDTPGARWPEGSPHHSHRARGSIHGDAGFAQNHFCQPGADQLVRPWQAVDRFAVHPEGQRSRFVVVGRGWFKSPGTNAVVVGLYSDNGGVVGTLLASGEASSEPAANWSP
jgi:hypothetical protein